MSSLRLALASAAIWCVVMNLAACGTTDLKAEPAEGEVVIPERPRDPETTSLLDNLAATSGVPREQFEDSLAMLRGAGLTETEVRLAMLEQGSAIRAQAAADAKKEFLGFKWGVGIGAVLNIGGADRVDTANVVNGYVRIAKEANDTARIFSEIHNFREINADATRGHGPFVAIQSSADELIDSFSAGYMRGWRKDANATSSLNIGFGLVLDTRVKELGNGIVQDQPLPPGEDPANVRLKERSRIGLGIFVSFSF